MYEVFKLAQFDIRVTFGDVITAHAQHISLSPSKQNYDAITGFGKSDFSIMN